MDISYLNEMGLIDNGTELIHDIGDTPIIFSQDGSLNINAEDLASCSDKITYVTVADVVPIQEIVQDGSSQNIAYLISNSQESSVGLPVIVNQDGFINLPGSTSFSEQSGDVLCEELSKYLTTPSIIISSDCDKPHEEDEPNCNLLWKTLSPPELEPVEPPDKTGPMRCDKCNINFRSWKHFKRHKLIHSHDKPFQCTACPESFNHVVNLKLHMATHNVTKPFCPVCKKRFNRIASLKAHILLHELEESLFCLICGDEFASHIYYQRHMLEHKTGKTELAKPVLQKPKVYICKICKKSFDTASSCKLHQMKAHKTKEATRKSNWKQRKCNTCEYCRKRFEKPSQLLRHKRIHTGEKPFKCELCSRGFSQKGTLTIHMLKHTRERPYVCEHCGISFSQKGNLTAHINRLHVTPDANVPVFKCSFCTCMFKKLGSLNAHLSRVHGDVISAGFLENREDETDNPDPSNKENENSKKINNTPEVPTTTAGQVTVAVRRCLTDDGTLKEEVIHGPVLTKILNRKPRELHTCEFCGKDFVKPSQLLRHKYTHTREKPFKCELCGMDFFRKAELSAHVAEHAGESRYICEHCGFVCANKDNLEYHVSLHKLPAGKDTILKCSLCSSTFRNLTGLNDHLCQVHLESSNDLQGFLEKTYPEEETDNPDSSNKENENSGEDPGKFQGMNDTPEVPTPVAMTVHRCLTDDGTLREEVIPDQVKPRGAQNPCPCCDQAFSSSSLLAQHLRVHNLEKPFRCKACTKCFSNAKALNKHQRRHEQLACSECQETFNSVQELVEHEKNHLSEGNQLINGDKRSLVEIEDINNGSSAFIILDQVDIPSLEAKNYFFTENGAVLNVANDTGEAEDSPPLLKCNECEMTFYEIDQFVSHSKTHSQLPASSYKCLFCPCSFKTQKNLSSHMNKRHLTERPSCKTCNKDFSSESSLKRHLESHHMDDFNWRCPVCEWSFRSFLQAKKHIHSAHPKSAEAKPLKLVEKPSEEFEIGGSRLQDEKNSIPVVIVNEMNDVISISPSQIYLIAGEDGGYTMFPAKDAAVNPLQQENHLQQDSIQQDNLQRDNLQEDNFQQDILQQVNFQQENLTQDNLPLSPLPKEIPGEDDNLETCIFTLQPGVEINDLLSGNIDSLQPHLISNRNDITNLLNNILESSINKNPDEDLPKQCDTPAPELQEPMKPQKKTTETNSMISSNECEASIDSQSSVLHCCSTCGLNFLTSNDLTSHQSSHESNRGRKNDAFVTDINDEGKNDGYKSEIFVNKYSCDTCGADFSTNHELEEHRTEHSLEECIICSICLEEFLSDETFQGHKCFQSSEKEKPLSLWRSTPRQLTDEETKILSNLQPDNASEKVLLQSLMEKEKFEHPPVKEDPKPTKVHENKCRFCPKSFRKPSDLIRHVRTHTGEKPFKCSQCPKRFSIKSAAVSHMKTHSKEKSYDCYVCGKLFSTTGSLKIHMRLHTGLRPFSCEYCSATFRTSGHKKVHMDKHLKKDHLPRVSDTTQDCIPDALSGALSIRAEERGTLGGRTAPTLDQEEELFSTPAKGGGRGVARRGQTAHSRDQEEEPFETPTKGGGSGGGDLVDIGDFLLQKGTAGGGPLEPSPKSSKLLEENHTTGTKNSRYLLNINDEGGGSNGESMRYFLSIKEGSSGEDGFVLESISDDQIVVTITKGDADLRTETPVVQSQPEITTKMAEMVPAEIYSCSYCHKTFYKESSLEKHIQKTHYKEIFQCSVCSEIFDRKSELDLHSLEHELDRQYTCSECSECFSLEEELRAHKCIKSPSLDLSLEQDLFLFS